MMFLLPAGAGWKIEKQKKKTVLLDVFDGADFIEEK